MDLAQLVQLAAAGDPDAWTELVRRYQGLVWATIRKIRISTDDAEDASQLTWLQLSLHIGKLREPEALGGWLAVTARREALRLAGRRLIHPITEEVRELADDRPGLDDGLLRAEARDQVRRGWLRLEERCRQLLGMLVRDPPASYAEVSAALGMPLGSVGPSRARCLQRLRQAAGL